MTTKKQLTPEQIAVLNLMVNGAFSSIAIHAIGGRISKGMRLEFSWWLLRPLWQHPGLAAGRIRTAATEKPTHRSRICNAHGAGHASQTGEGGLTREGGSAAGQ
jgi:hypothetical protein